MSTHTLFLIFILALVSHLSAIAQTTVGSAIPANLGAILDLKQNNETANSKKGLGLPRVWLQNPTRLYIGKGGTPTNITDPNEKLAHTGLIVYNLNQCMSSSRYETDHIGIHVWNGDQWIQLSKNVSLGESVSKHLDQDGNEFLSGDFGDAGIWMLQNVRARKYASADGKSKVGEMLPSAPNPIVSINAPNDIQWTYSGVDDSKIPNPLPEGALGIYDGTDPFYFNQHPVMGLLYSWNAAIGRENIVYRTTGGGDQQQSTNDDQSPGAKEVEVVEGKHIRGICPEGWHLPTDREWSKLEKELAEKPQKYTDGGEPLIWGGGNHGWTTQVNYYGTHAPHFQHQCGLPYSTFSGWTAVLVNTKSKSRYKGGFDSLPVGENRNGKLNHYGSSGYYWTASGLGATSSGYAYSKSIGVNLSYFFTTQSSRREMFSVRCKQD